MTIQTNFPNLKPTLLLDFANVKALDPRITFTRASEGRYYDGKTFAKAEENLMVASQELDSVLWTKELLTVTANTGATTAPDGTSTADKLVETSATGIHRIYRVPESIAASSAYTCSCFLKAAERGFALLVFSNTNFDTVSVNLSTGAATSANGSPTNITSTNAGNGWWRVSFTATASAASNWFGVTISTDGVYANRSYAGDGTSGIYAWGAQLEQRSAVTAYTATTTQPITNYIPVLMTAAAGVARFDHNPVTGASDGFLVEEQRTNLLTYSAQFDNAAWTKTRSSITANTIVAPDGTLTGDKLVEDTTVSNTHVVYAPDYAATNTTLTATVYAKAGERSQFFLELSNFATGFGGALFNLSTGVATNITNAGDYTNTSASISAVGNGWYRCSITTTKGSLNSTNRWIIELYNGSTTQYTGNGYAGIYIWGAQLEAGAFPTSYIPTVAAQVTRSADAASMTGANFSSWYNQAQSTVYAEYSARNGGRAIMFDDGSLNNRFEIRFTSNTSQLNSWSGNVQQINSLFAPTATGLPEGVILKSSAGLLLNDAATTANAAAPGTDTSCLMPISLTRVFLGSFQGTATFLNGTIRKIAYYPIRCTNEQLQALTS